jgi:ParB-like chromosome segregation protein Spo0J
MNILEIPIEKINPPKKIVKKHTKQQISDIVNCIKSTTQYSPILVQKKSMCIIAGYAVFLALKKMKSEKVLCCLIDVDDETANSIQFTDNFTNESSEWNKDKLEYLFMQLPNDLVKNTGFTENEIENIFNSTNDLIKIIEEDKKTEIEKNIKEEKIEFKKIYICECCNKYYDIETEEEVEIDNIYP